MATTLGTAHINTELSVMEKRAKLNSAVLHRDPLEFEVCEKSPASKCKASVLIDLIIESAGKLVVKPPVTVSRGLCLAASHDTSCDSHITVVTVVGQASERVNMQKMSGRHFFDDFSCCLHSVLSL